MVKRRKLLPSTKPDKLGVWQVDPSYDNLPTPSDKFETYIIIPIID